MKKELKAALETMQGLMEELQSQVNEFEANRTSWYQRNLMLNDSELMDDAEFGAEVRNRYHELRISFDTDVYAMKQVLNGFFEGYLGFKRKSEELDIILKNEKNRVPEGWKSYKVLYDEKGCAVPQEFYCYAPDEEKVKELLKNVNGKDVKSIIYAREVEL